MVIFFFCRCLLPSFGIFLDWSSNKFI
jgi:hypothetical protein